VRLVLFVVAADEGWKPQSEEHLQILDVLGVRGGVIALTKRDLVDDEMLELAMEEVRDHVAGTALADAAIVPVSSETGEGVDALAAALDEMLDHAGPAEDARARLHIDRVFTIKGAGTVVTGTLAGACLHVGDDVEISPAGIRSRVRSLQTHKQSEAEACPVSRVAANLVGVERDGFGRGQVLAFPGQWRSTTVFEARLRPVRGLSRPVTARGAFKLYVGTAEVDARVRLYGTTKLGTGDEAFVRITATTPIVLDVGDRFVLRESGRGETVAGGDVLDVSPPSRAGADPIARLRARAAAPRDDLPALLVEERGAIRAADVFGLTGSRAGGGTGVGEWLVAEALGAAVETSVVDTLSAYHAEHPLEPGAGLTVARRAVMTVLRSARAPTDTALVDALLAGMADRGTTTMEATTIRLPSHRVALDERSADVDRLLEAISGSAEATPPTVKELVAGGVARDVIDAAAREGLLVRLTPDLVVTPAFVGRAEAAIGAAGEDGITVSALRESLGTSRKYAVPLMEWLDQRGVTKRVGDVRFLRRRNDS
jgi:selenocysteine-specific elongation factor